ncbi:uncharacterized protein LOC136031078 [Artemia franciscana]|uniref:uncharacterized protein LOC136031078 n=1 Tax=Artemia franciscana TaxID=6661 RepID=UPI0032D9AE0A
MEDVLIRQAHVSKVVPRVNKPPPPPRATATKTAVQKSLELEIERLKSSQKNVSALNDVLCLNLEESRTQCEKFFTLLLKYESAVGTQQLVIDASHKLCDAYEYLVRLLDVKNTLASSSVLGGSDGIQSCLNCRSNSIQSCSSEGSSDSRPDAKELFSRLNGSADSRFLEKKLRLLISKLDEERKSYDGLINIPEIPVESLADESKFGTTASTTDQNKEGVEMKVLIQEMMSLKEERAELRCRLFDYERKEESRVVPKYFPGLTTCLQDLVEADKMNPDSNLEVKISQLSQLIRSSALAYQSKEDELNQTISKMKHMLKFLLQLIGRQKRGSQFELQTLEELLQKCPL